MANVGVKEHGAFRSGAATPAWNAAIENIDLNSVMPALQQFFPSGKDVNSLSIVERGVALGELQAENITPETLTPEIYARALESALRSLRSAQTEIAKAVEKGPAQDIPRQIARLEMLAPYESFLGNEYSATRKMAVRRYNKEVGVKFEFALAEWRSSLDAGNPSRRFAGVDAGRNPALGALPVLSPADAETATRLMAMEEQGIGNQGLLTAQFPPSGPIELSVQDRGIVPGWVPIFVVPNEEAALTHSLSSPKRLRDKSINRRLQGFYLIGNVDLNQINPEDVPRVFEELSRGQRLFWFEDGDVKKEVDEKQTQAILNPQTMTIDKTPSWYPGQYFRQKAWLRPPTRAVIKFETTQSGKTYKRIRAKCRQLIDQGYSIKFDGDFEAALKLTAETKRKTANRYDADRVQAVLEMFKAGHAHSWEIWKDGRLMGGTIHIIQGALDKVDTIFMADNLPENIRTDLPMMADYAFIVWMHERGIDWTDGGSMIAPHYSDTIGAELISVGEFRQLSAQLPASVSMPIDFSFFLKYIARRSMRQPRPTSASIVRSP